MKITVKLKLQYLFILLFGFWFSVLNSQTNWSKNNDNPVLTPGPDNWDKIAIGQPTVLFENDTMKMWYVGVGNDGKARICYAYSIDGINWTKHNNPVIDVGSQGDWDSGWLDTPEILKDSNGYKMYYYGDTTQQFSAINSAIGVAYSQDGINWTKDTNNPIFEKGNIGEWDGSWIESPALHWDNISDEYKMWYNGVDTATWKVQIGLATSSDGVNWTKHTGNPVLSTSPWGDYDDMWIGTPSVLFNGNEYEMWYSGTSSSSYNSSTGDFDTISICYATSINGVNWVKHQNNPLFHTFTAPYDSLIDSGGPWAADIVLNANTGTYMMWFEGHGGFSLATAPNNTTDINAPNSMSSDLWIYPNPVKSSATIKTTEKLDNATLKIYNTMGQTILLIESIYGNKILIEKDNIDSGLYLLQLKNNNKLTTKKIIFK